MARFAIRRDGGSPLLFLVLRHLGFGAIGWERLSRDLIVFVDRVLDIVVACMSCLLVCILSGLGVFSCFSFTFLVVVDPSLSSSVYLHGWIPRSATDPTQRVGLSSGIVYAGSSERGSMNEHIGTAPSNGLLSKVRAEWKLSSK